MGMSRQFSKKEIQLINMYFLSFFRHSTSLAIGEVHIGKLQIKTSLSLISEWQDQDIKWQQMTVEMEEGGKFMYF